MNEQRHYYKPGRKKNNSLYPDRWWSYWTKPCGKMSKRQASKRARNSDLPNGNAYKKIYGWFEWC